MRKITMIALAFCLGIPTGMQTQQLNDVRSSPLSFGYTNPVLPGFYPDPSVCRVEDDFYLVTSSFCYFPAVPIFHSRDLIHWEQIGNCLNRPSQVNLTKADAWSGIYAPTIRYHKGIFYMIVTNVTDRTQVGRPGDNFLVYTTDPRGEWSEPVWLQQGGIDPSLYFEVDQCYMVSNPDNYLTLCEINPQTGQQLTPSRKIWAGTGGRYPEAPHIYQKDGWYYLLASEGGTEYGHRVTIARSREIYGPYESNPANPILTHMNLNAQTNPIQGTGHGDIVQARDGSWWMTFLAFRPQEGTHHLTGRETYLAPLEWNENAWPVVNGNGTVSIQMNVPTLPQQENIKRVARCEFEEDVLAPQWQYLRNPTVEHYSLKQGKLTMQMAKALGNGIESPSFIGRRQEQAEFTASTQVRLLNAEEGDEAGLTLYMDNDSHAEIFIRQEAGRKQLIVRYVLGSINHIEQSIALPNEKLSLMVKGTKSDYEFGYCLSGQSFISLSRLNTRYLSTETAGGFTGIMIGMYAQAGQKSTAGKAAFEYFEYK